MRLTLSTLRCPDNVAPETRSVGGGEFTLGRAPDNSWVLADPDRHLSKRHCVLAFRGGGWQLADTSTNGTFLNREGEPVGPGAVRDLRDGDRIRLGAYEIELRIEEEALAPPPPSAFRGGANPFDDDPFAPPPTQAATPSPSWREPEPLLPPDFDPLASSDRLDPFTGPSVADHSPAVGDAFRPPPVTHGPPGAGGLPDDWDLDEPLLPPAAPAAPPPSDPFVEAASPWESTPPPAPRPAAAAAMPAAFAPEPAPPPPPPAAAVAAPPAMPVQPPVQPPMHPPRHAAAAAPDDGALLAAFLDGAGMSGARVDDPAGTMHALGGAFRALVAGLRAVLIARAAIKGEFRIEQTMIRARGNNPLKFSADDDDALAALLGSGRRAGMPAPDAVAEALRDLRLHEIATVAAMQAAVRELVAELSPEAAQAAAGSGGLLPVQRKARAFEAYEARHAALESALSDDFDSAFGRAFAKAYEAALDQAAAKPEDS